MLYAIWYIPYFVLLYSITRLLYNIHKCYMLPPKMPDGLNHIKTSAMWNTGGLCPFWVLRPFRWVLRPSRLHKWCSGSNTILWKHNVHDGFNHPFLFGSNRLMNTKFVKEWIPSLFIQWSWPWCQHPQFWDTDLHCKI